MKVVILCGGRGSRLGDQTELVPKPLIEVGGKPILWHIMKIYASYGYAEFVLCLGYKGHRIKEYFLNYDLHQSDITLTLGSRETAVTHRQHNEHGWRIHLVDTGAEAMTGARIKRIEPLIDTPDFLLTYGDGVADIDLDALMAFHRSHGKIATITGVHPLSRFGEVIVEGQQVVEFSEKSQVRQGCINGGFFILRREVFRYLRDDDRCAFEQEPLEQLAKDGQMMVYRHAGMWQCLDTQRDLQVLNDYWIRHPFWKVWEERRVRRKHSGLIGASSLPGAPGSSARV